MKLSPNEVAAALARERAQAMLRLLQRGDTLSSVAAVYSISRQRVHELVRKHFPGETWPGDRGART